MAEQPQVAIWCEWCREHFPQTHYDEAGNHRVGSEWGPGGETLAALDKIVQREDADNAVRRECGEQLRATIRPMLDDCGSWFMLLSELADGWDPPPTSR